MTPQETDRDLPVSVQESLAEVWVSSSLLQGWGTECSSACMGPLEGGGIIFITSTIVWPQINNRKFHGWRSLVGYSPQGRKELDTISLSLSVSLDAQASIVFEAAGSRDVNCSFRYSQGT